MKLLLISANMARPPVMPIGMRYIADAAIRAGHQVSCLDLCFEALSGVQPAVRRRIHEWTPDVIAVSLRNLDVEDPDRIDRYNFATYNLANYSMAAYAKVENERPTNLECFDATIEACRSTVNVPLVLGGPAFTLLPRQFLSRYPGTIGVVGPGEVPFVRLLRALEAKEDYAEIKGIVTPVSTDAAFHAVDPAQLPEIPQLRETAIPAYLIGDGEYSIQSKRGCVFGCIHCSYPLIEGNRIRTHGPEEVASLVRALAREGVTRFRFVDSVFNNPVSHAAAVCESLLKVVPPRISFTVNCSPALMPRHLALSLKNAGCAKVIFGTDTASERMLAVMRKPFTKDHIRRATEVCEEAGLYFEHHMLLGAPGETAATVMESLEFMDSLDCSVFWDVGIQVYENTPLAKMLDAVPVPNGELVPPIFVEPEVANELPNMIVDYCASRRNMHTFIVERDVQSPSTAADLGAGRPEAALVFLSLEPVR